VALAAALILALTAVPIASAQAIPEDDPNFVTLFDGTAGPYTVRIIQSPPEAVVGSLRVIVEPVETATGKPVTSAIVRVFGNPSEEGERQYSPGLNAPIDPSLYVAQLELDNSGIWTIEVEIDAGPGIAKAFAQTSVRDRARSGSSTQVGTALFILISVAFVGAGFWLWLSSKKARARKAAMIAAGRQPRTMG
jgi:hypothetical protein